MGKIVVSQDIKEELVVAPAPWRLSPNLISFPLLTFFNLIFSVTLNSNTIHVDRCAGTKNYRSVFSCILFLFVVF